MASGTHMSGKERGIELLRYPRRNKSTAFTEAEREVLGLTGLLPSGVEDEATRVRRALQQLGDKPTDLERYIYLIGLLDSDEVLFYKVVMSDPDAVAAIPRRPAGVLPVGDGCLPDYEGI
jgi:malate dehydrogenase (oxaloacetate-decarboxylating)(NADP+)